MNDIVPVMTSEAQRRRYLEAKRRFWGKPEAKCKIPETIQQQRAERARRRAAELAERRQSVEQTSCSIFPADEREDIAEILTRHGKTWEDIFRSTTDRATVQCRHELWHLLVEKYGWNYINLGDVFGRDRNTIRHGHKRWKNYLVKQKLLATERQVCMMGNEAS